MRRLMVLAALALVAAAPYPENDLRGLRVGMTQAELPTDGFANFRCADGGAEISGWADWRRCKADSQGRHDVRFDYSQGRTIVGGHPVVLTAGFAADGRLAELGIVTDSSAPLFLRKKAFMLAKQARSRYGDEGWSCRSLPPDATAEPVGGVFIRETCRKLLSDRALVVECNLFRRPGTELRAFIGESRITITALPKPATLGSRLPD